MAKKKQKETKKVSVQTYGAEAQGAQINLPKSNPTPISEPKKKTTTTKKTTTKKTTDNHQRNPKDAEIIKRNVRKNEIQIKYKNVYDLGQKVKNGTATDLEKAEFGARQRTFLGNISDATTMIGFQSLYDRYEKFAVGQDYDVNKVSAGIEIAKILEKDMQKRMEYAALFDEKNFENVDSLYGTIKSAKEHLTNAKSNMEKYGNENEYRIFRTYSNFSDIKDLEDTRYNLVKQKEEMQRVGGFEKEIADIDKRLEYIDQYAYNDNILSQMDVDSYDELMNRIDYQFRQAKNNTEKYKSTAYIDNFYADAKKRGLSDEEARKEFQEAQKASDDYYRTLSDQYNYVKEFKREKSIEEEIKTKWEGMVSESDNFTPSDNPGYDPTFSAINYKQFLPTIAGDGERVSPEVVSFVTQKERKRYNQIRNKYGKEKADEYVSDIMPYLNKRWSLSKEKEAAEFASEHEILATIEKTITSPIRTIVGVGNNIYNLGATLLGEEIDPYDPRFSLHRRANAQTEAIENEIDSPVWKVIYGAGTQAAELFLNMAVAGGIGKIAGGMSGSANASQIASKVSNVSNQILLSSNSMLDTTLKYKESGESDLAAVGMGLISAIIEAWTERNSMSRLFESPNVYKELTGKEFAKAFAKSSGINFLQEGKEEVQANILNTFAAMVFDLRKNDSFLKALDEASANGEAGAFWKALKSVAPEYIESFAVGGLAGLVFGAVNTLSGRSKYTRARESAEAYFGENGYSEEALFGLMTTQADSLPDALAMAETVQKATRGELWGKEAEALSDNPVLSGVFTAYKKGYAPRTNAETESASAETAKEPEYKSELDRIIHQPTLSNKNIDDIINNESAREEFQSLTGVKLEGTKAEMREAVKQWKVIEDYKQRQKDNRGKKWVTVEEARDGKKKESTVPAMPKEEAQQIINQTDIATRSEGREGAKVTSNAYDTTNPTSFISKLIKDGYSEESATKIIDGVYSFVYSRGRQGADLQESIRAIESEIFDGSTKYKNELTTFYMAGAKDSANWMMGKENAKVIQSDTLKRLLKEKKIDHRTIRAMNAIARKLGIDIIFSDDVDGDGEFNTKTGVLKINAKAKNRFFVTSVHESIHALRTIDPESYNRITDVVYEVLNKNEEVFSKAWGKTLAIYKKEATDKDGNVNKDYIDEELNAKVISELLTNEEFIKELAKEDIGLAKRILNWLIDLFDKIVVRYSEESNASYEINEALKALKNEFNTIKTMYQTALESTESMQGETIESGLQDGVYNKKQSVAKNRNTFYNKDYWHTDLNKTEFKMLEGWINKAGFPEHTKITDTTNWYEGRLNGEPIFAVYSSIYANNPTILYEVRGKNAVIEKDILLDLLEEQDNGTNINGQSSFTQGISQRNWMQNVNGSQNHRRNMGKRTDSRNAGVLPQQPKGNGSRAFWNVIQNIFEIQEETRNGINSNDVLKSKPDTTTEVVLKSVNIEYDSESDSVAPVFYSRNTWEQSEYVQDEDVAVSALVKAINVSEKDARRYINNINSIAKLIADDKARLDYEPNADDFASVLKSNSEYKWTVDMSTLCAKRLLFTGTFDAIQKKMPNKAFTSEEIVALRSMMMERGYEVACGICYVESTRRELGPITEEFIKRYKVSQKTGNPISRVNSKGKEVELTKTKAQMKTTRDKTTNKFVADKNYTPTLADLNTTDIDKVKIEHPLVYEAYLNFMNARGQAKPKLLETRAEYKGEILKHFKSKNAVNARNRSGGLRVQSFSDFEVAHLIDMMQIALDMSRVGLMSQAYTKVPEFAEVFGDTGIKINLSLIAKDSGLDENGNLIFDDVEGMPHKRAFDLRQKYSKNVGTILVGKNDDHIRAALSDPRIDFVIPFHKSSWKESLYGVLGLSGYEDYTDFQNEKPWDTSRKIKNLQPSEYWDENLSGYENAQNYLKRCFEDQRTPKFPQFAKEEGYWKLLIDFKMYDNDGNFSPQTKVMPEFNMGKANEILNSYKGGHQSLPVANDVVNDFVNVFKSKSESDTDVPIDTNITPGKRRTTAQKTQGAFQLKEEVRKKLEQQAEKYGEMEKGEMPSRDVTIPKETDAGKVRTFQRTAIEADSVSDEAAREIAESIANEELSSVYSVVSNKKVYEESKRLLEVRGFDSMLNEWEALLESGRKIEKQDISNAMLLVTEAGKNGDTETEVRILTQLAAEATAAGQSVQAFSLLKRLGPNAQTYAMNRTIERIKRDIDKKYGKQIEVPENLLTQYEEALKKEREAGNGNTVESDKYADQIMRYIGEQIPANWLDKWNAWRMLSMLGNAKTHLRNFGSNLVMWPVRFFKDMTAIGLERVFLDKSKRTKTLKGQFTRGDILNFAKEDAKKIESVLRGESKYGDLVGFGNMQDYRRIFKTDWLEGLSKKNSELLEKEDWWGLKLNYARAFTNYVVSQNLDVNNLTEEQLASARKIAVKEAQKATFRDANAVATWLNSAHDKSEVLGFAVDAVIPFKKTPMNVLKRGVEYSPVGLIKSLSWGIYQVRSGKINANEFIDGIASGVTGTGLMLIGMLLKSAGLLRGVGDDDENEGRLSKLVGKQNYALVIGDHSYTIEWLSPSAMPLFVGCEFMGLLNEENISLGEFVKSFSRVLEPAFEMSMLKSINDLLSVALYEDLSSAALTSLGLEIPLEYLGQSVPTALGQVAKTIDNTRRKTYIKKDGWMSLVPDFVQSFIQQQMKKIPFLTFAFEEYVNEKGQTEKNAEGNIFSRVLQNFISPGYYKKVKSTAVDEEISRLYKTVDGASGIIPKTAKKTIKVDGKDYHLSAEQHNTYQEEMGKTYYEKAKEIITSDYYKGLSDSEKVKLLEKAMEYAGDKGKHKAVPEYKIENGWLKTAMEIPGGYKYLIETNKSAKFSEKDLESDAFDNYESQRDSMFRDILSNSELPTEDDAFMDKYYANLYQFTEDVALEANSDGQFTIDTKWINEIKGLSAEQQAEYIYGKTLRSMYDTDAEANTAINNDPNISSAIKLKLLNDVTVIPKSPEKSYKEHNLTKYKISSDTWLDVYNEYNKIKEIKQPNGKTLSKKDQIIMYINSKKISDEQKSALYRALGYKDTGKNLKVPWSYRFDLTNPTDYEDAVGYKVAYTNTSNYNNDAKKGQCVWYARGRAKEKLSVNIPPLGNANQMYASAKPEARLEVKKSNIKPNTLVTYKVGTSEAGQTAGHVIYIEDVVGDTVYYTEGGYGSSNGVVKKSTKDNIMKGLSGNNSTIGTYINGIIDVTKY